MAGDREKAMRGRGDAGGYSRAVARESDRGGAERATFEAGRVEISSWFGKNLVLLIGLSVASVMFAISAVMNFRFGLTLGSGSVDPLLYGLASVTADGFKALLPFIAIGLWRARKPLLTLSAMGIWCLCVAWSMASAMGFATTTRDETIAVRDATNDERTALSQRAERLESQVALLPKHRPAGAIRAAIANADVPRDVWRRTSQCTDVTIPASLRACQEVLDLRKELGIAEDAARLERQLIETRRELRGIKVVGEKSDPQAETISGVLGLAPEQVRSGLAVLITLLIETGSALGFTLVALGAGHLRVNRLPPKPSRKHRQDMALKMMEQYLDRIELENTRERATLTFERVQYEEQLTQALQQIYGAQKSRPRAGQLTAEASEPAQPQEAPQREDQEASRSAEEGSRSAEEGSSQAEEASSKAEEAPSPSVPATAPSDEAPQQGGASATDHDAPPTLPQPVVAEPENDATAFGVNQDPLNHQPAEESQETSTAEGPNAADAAQVELAAAKQAAEQVAHVKEVLERESEAREAAEREAAALRQSAEAEAKMKDAAERKALEVEQDLEKTKLALRAAEESRLRERAARLEAQAKAQRAGAVEAAPAQPSAEPDAPTRTPPLEAPQRSDVPSDRSLVAKAESKTQLKAEPKTQPKAEPKAEPKAPDNRPAAGETSAASAPNLLAATATPKAKKEIRLEPSRQRRPVPLKGRK